MEERMEDMVSPVCVRIFVGGLSESVAEDDLKKTFGSLRLGNLEGLEIIRSKGRSFAYFNFIPSSPTSLSKLLSTYNGCLWKGGKLRLEKAKEHYLVRLRREWAEDAELSKASSDAVDSTRNTALLYKLQKDVHSEGHLCIFFSKLRKVKALPLRGTGKHKYSFQRVEVPLLPKYFCDCEEHSDPPPPLQKQTHEIEAHSGGINAEEIDMMNSVMSRLFQREMNSYVQECGTKLAKENGTSRAVFIKQHSKGNVANLAAEHKLEENKPDHSEDENEDEDMVINITGARTKIPEEVYNFSTNQKSDSKKRRISEDMPASHMLKDLKSSNSPAKKKIKKLADRQSNCKLSSASMPEAKDKLQMHANMTRLVAELRLTKSDSGNQQKSQKSSWKALGGDSHNDTFSISHILLGANTVTEGQPNFDNKGVRDSPECKEESLFREEEGSGQKTQDLKKVKESAEAQSQPTISNAASNKSGRGISWLHKSSWTQLVAEEKNRPFSISQILSAETSEEKKALDAENVNIRAETLEEKEGLDAENISNGNFTNKKQQEKALEDGSDTLSSEKEELHFEAQNSSIASSSKDEMIHRSGVSVSINNTSPTLPSFDKKQFSISISEECPFMRSEASLRDWAKSKAALMGSRKRKK